jgi:hypothetical protein
LCGFVDHTKQQYQPDNSIHADPESYTNCWIVKPTELLADKWNISFTSGNQTTIVKVKYHPTGQIFVQARTSHATPSNH